jgi:hypothetical protein
VPTVPIAHDRSAARNAAGAEMNAERTAVALHQDLEIPSCLGRLDHTKRVFPSRHGHIDGVIARNLQEYARVHTTLIGLSR